MEFSQPELSTARAAFGAPAAARAKCDSENIFRSFLGDCAEIRPGVARPARRQRYSARDL
jgi:hypothetical protein